MAEAMELLAHDGVKEVTVLHYKALDLFHDEKCALTIHADEIIKGSHWMDQLDLEPGHEVVARVVISVNLHVLVILSSRCLSCFLDLV